MARNLQISNQYLHPPSTLTFRGRISINDDNTLQLQPVWKKKQDVTYNHLLSMKKLRQKQQQRENSTLTEDMIYIFSVRRSAADKDRTGV
jgi:uncharacterized protein YihD (DUF1040 family)